MAARPAQMLGAAARRFARRARSMAARRQSQHRPGAAPSPPAEFQGAGLRVDPLPLPAGWTRDDMYRLLTSVSIDNASPAELAPYVGQDFERFLLTWDLVRDRNGPALEIGANPYFSSVLLREFTGMDVTFTNSFGGPELAMESQLVSYRGPDGSGVDREDRIEYVSLNVESTRFPFGTGQFETILFCEVIEHLTTDPVGALTEINRVLADGGVLVVTTPNVARLENVARLAAGANMYDPYSGYGPYGRHNREYTRHELVKLLEFCGFVVEHHFTADVHPHHAAGFVDPLEKLMPLVRHRAADLGQYVFCRAVKVAEPRAGRPAELYRSWAADPLVPFA